MPVEAPPAALALQWVRAHRLKDGGIVPFSGGTVATQEVTGYLIPTLRSAGEATLAMDLARWCARVQKADGSFTAIDGVPYTFDTAQAMRGLLAMLDVMPELEPHIERGCDFIASQVGADGKVNTPSYDLWRFENGTVFSEYADLYVLQPLIEAGERFGAPRFMHAASRAHDRFRRAPDLTTFKPSLGTFSHIFGYMMEALAELGDTELARRGLAQAAVLQTANGAIPAYPGATWVCATGVAQLALAWYRVGDHEPADRAVDYLESIQNPSGGFFGGYGRGVEYFPNQEVSWAAKFFLDAVSWRDRHSPVSASV